MAILSQRAALRQGDPRHANAPKGISLERDASDKEWAHSLQEELGSEPRSQRPKGDKSGPRSTADQKEQYGHERGKPLARYEAAER